MKIIFADINPKVTEQLSIYFANTSNVEVHTGDIFEYKTDAIVSPSNSFGFMDGGIDLVYSKHFGWDLEKRVQQVIQSDFEGELLVGQACIVPTNNDEIPWLVSAPTMRVPMNLIDSVNVYLAFRAALRAVKSHNLNIQLHQENNLDEFLTSKKQINSILCPGLGTFVGNLDPKIAAAQMFIAYNEVVRGHKCERFNCQDIMAAHHNHYLIVKGIV